jgi:cystathionine beta-lyase/cystathionine gamma-synthase
MRNFGGMVSFLLGDEQEAVDLVSRTRIWKLAESLAASRASSSIPRA